MPGLRNFASCRAEGRSFIAKFRKISPGFCRGRRSFVRDWQVQGCGSRGTTTIAPPEARLGGACDLLHRPRSPTWTHY